MCEDTGRVKRSAFRHSTAAELLQSSSTCDFCALIRDAFLGNHPLRDDRFLYEFPDAWIQLGAVRLHIVPKAGNIWSIRPFIVVVSSHPHHRVGRLCLCSPSGMCVRGGWFTLD